MGARELFEDAARAVRRLSVVTAELDALEQAWRCGDWLTIGVSRWSSHSDPTATRAGYRMGRTDALESELSALRSTVEEARALAEGIGELLGASYRDALALRYLENHQWQEVADQMGVSVSTARNRVSVGLDTVDAMGAPRVMQGQGVAMG